MCVTCKKNACRLTPDDLLMHAQSHVQYNVRCQTCGHFIKSGNWNNAERALNRLRDELKVQGWGFDAYGKPTCGDCLKRQETRTHALAAAIEKQKQRLEESFRRATGRPLSGDASTWRLHVPFRTELKGGDVDVDA